MIDTMGDRMKLYEGQEADRTLLPFLPVLARLDGRAFHSFCSGLNKPCDERFQRLMMVTTKFLVEETEALVGYTQSDEISLLWYTEKPDEVPFFGGRVQKLTSVLAALATAKFNRVLPEFLPEKANKMPVFDCRVWVVPNKDEAAHTIMWREMDATRNSISSAGRAHFSHKSLEGLDGKEIQEKLFQERGINWNDYPSVFKRGAYFQKEVLRTPFTTEELEALPPMHDARKNPNLVVERRRFVQKEFPPMRSIANRVEVLFDGAPAILKAGHGNKAVSETERNEPVPEDNDNIVRKNVTKSCSKCGAPVTTDAFEQRVECVACRLKSE